MRLFEQYRPRSWSEVVGQEKTLAKLDVLRRRGLGGRAFWISGQSGSGKTTIARLIADELCDEFCIDERDAGEITPAGLRELERGLQCRGLGKGGRALIINEAHGLRKDSIRQLLVMLERLPSHVVVVFTTTVDGQESLFEDCEDTGPLLSRCELLPLARRDLARPFAERALQIARAEGLDGQPIEKYVRLLQDCKNNLREALGRIEAGVMIGGAS